MPILNSCHSGLLLNDIVIAITIANNIICITFVDFLNFKAGHILSFDEIWVVVVCIGAGGERGLGLLFAIVFVLPCGALGEHIVESVLLVVQVTASNLCLLQDCGSINRLLLHNLNYCIFVTL